MALKNMVSGVGKGAARISERFDDLLFLLLKLTAIGVGGLAVYKYSGLRAPADDYLGWLLLFGLGLAAIGFEYYGAQTAVDGWYDRSVGTTVLGIGLCLPALALSYSNAISSAAVQQDKAAGLQKAAYYSTADTRQALKDAEDELSRLKAKHDWSKSLGAPSSYDARIEAARKDADYEATRGGCKSKCIAKQQLLASLEAERANAIDRAATAEEIKVAERKVDDARKAASHTPVTVSEVRADTLEYAAWFGTDETGGQTMQARHIAITITLFITLAGFLSALKRNRGRNPGPWGFFMALRRIWHKLWNGWDSEPEGRVVNNVHVTTDRILAPAIQKAIQSVDARMAAAA